MPVVLNGNSHNRQQYESVLKGKNRATIHFRSHTPKSIFKGHQNSKRILHPKCTLAPFSIDKILETSKMSKDR